MNQQRRQFFQAVTSRSTPLQRILSWAFQARGFRLCGRIAATFAVLLILSCSSLTPERVNLLAAIAGQAAQIGAQQWLTKHPEHRESFEFVIAAIQALVRGGVTNQAAYAELLQSLPTATLAGPSGELYVTEDRLVVWDSELRKAVAVRGEAEQPVIRATVAGLKRAMLPLPPMPVVSRAGRTLPRVTTNRVVVPVAEVDYHPDYQRYFKENPRAGWVRTNQLFTPTVALTNVAAVARVAPTAPGEPEAAPPLQLSRTNVTRSVVDVTHNDGAASMVSVRWVLGPASVYHVERREGEGWCRFASVTNATATGQTNWCAAWSPTQPAGTWRVLRVR